MAKGVPSNDEERLPWLEPYRDSITRTPPPRARRSTRGAGLIVGGVAAIAAALTAGYYIGQRDAAPPPAPTRVAEAPVTSLPVRTDPVTPPVAPAPVAAEKIAETSVPAPPKIAAKTAAKPVRRVDRQRQVRSAAAQRSRARQIRAAAAAERAAAARQARARQIRIAQAKARAARPASPAVRVHYRAWPKMPSPGPAGQVVQLGAYRTEGRALAAYRSRLSRYPVLGSMPRVVVPVMTQPRGQVLYVLRVGTSSRQQSRIVCRNLKASGDHCIVIG